MELSHNIYIKSNLTEAESEGTFWKIKNVCVFWQMLHYSC